MEQCHHEVTSLFSLEKRNLFPGAPHITAMGVLVHSIIYEPLWISPLSC
ncbi:hypothetical protein PVL29_024822 [Vitis rotundifolia]|uniref:Uncharacterized protein n=1 Tax=Vitis rotundifolia TaxID=103349 RepID=A0AA38YST1_VITRO|nr:hypothetical protein PVL29_024822 [Vitis rotundifolia]